VPAYFKTLKTGNIISKNGNTFKVINIGKVKALRVSYIYLDGSKLSLNEINKLRPQIISQYKKGSKFSDLAKKYTMDGNLNADLNWFTEDMMVTEFVNAIKIHNKGEIFTVDVPENKWYYVTLKTYEDIEVSKISILKVKSSS
jgi:parvulin-like peptidyl-prolyl isomerase